MIFLFFLLFFCVAKRLSSSFTRLDYRRYGVFSIPNDSLHIVLLKGVSDSSKIDLFSFYTTLKFEVRKLLI